MSLQCHRISSSEPSSDIIRRLRGLAATIFRPYLTENEQNHPSFQLSRWEERIGLPNAVIYYATDSRSTGPLGFFFAMPQTQPEIGHELLHIWLAAVDPKSQGLGIFPFLLDHMKQHALDCGYEELTVCTHPEKFEKMYRILDKNGWEEVAWIEPGEKVLMRMTI